MNYKNSKKKYFSLVISIIMLLLGAAIFIFYLNNFLGRTLGIVICIISVYFAKISNPHRLKDLHDLNNDSSYFAKPKHPSVSAWAAGVISLLALGASFIYLYQDALDGYHKIWPVYAFAGSAMLSIVVCGYLISKFM